VGFDHGANLFQRDFSLKTAKALGLTTPSSMLALADELIE